MHILFVPVMYPNHYYPESNIFFRDQAEALVKCGNRVGVLALVPITIRYIIAKRKLCFGLKISNQHGVSTYLYEFPVPPHSQRFQQWFRKYMGLLLFKKYIQKHGTPDIQHVHVYRAAITARIIKQKYHIPYVMTEHLSLLIRGLISRYENKIAEIAFRESSGNCAVSTRFAEYLSLKYKVYFDYVPNIVETEYFTPDSDNTGNEKGHIVITNIANLDSIKQQLMLIKAVERILPLYPDVHLCIGGDGLEYNNLSNYIEKSGLKNNIFLLGHLTREEVRAAMRKCDIFALSSAIETFGVVLIEAMSCGKPVVSTKSGGPESIIINPELGELVENSEEGLAKGLIRVIQNIHNYDHDKIRNYVINTFSVNAVCKKIAGIYDHILKNEKQKSFS